MSDTRQEEPTESVDVRLIENPVEDRIDPRDSADVFPKPGTPEWG